MAEGAAPTQQGMGPAAKRYASKLFSREPYLVRARRCSRLTVPSLFRELGEDETTSETVPWQTMGAYGVNCISAKLVLTLFPSGIPFINLKQDKKALAGLAQLDPEVRGKLKAEIDKGLSGVEREFMEGVEEDGDRWRLFDAMRHAVVGGNHCIKVEPDASLKSIPLEQYIVVRDGGGRLVEFIVEDEMEWETLPADIQQHCLAKGYVVQYEETGNKAPIPNQKPVRVYTRGYRITAPGVGTRFKVSQEVWGEDVPGTEAIYNEDALPYVFLRMVALKKESYGRSYVEDYEGDLQTLDGFWQILTEGSAAIAQLKWLVKSGSTTNKKQFAELPNGGVMTGDPEDVGAVHSEHQGDLMVASSRADRIETRLEKVFIINSSVQRNGERVTAEEIRYMARELENTLGGVYSNQVTTFQAPYAALKMAALQRNGRVTQLPKGTTKMTILTGDAALGRMQKAQTLDEYVQTAAAVATAMAQSPIAAYLNWETYLNRSAANRGIDTDGLIHTEEEVTEQQNQAQQQALAAQVAPEVVKQGGSMIQNSQQAALDQGASTMPPQQATPAAPVPQPQPA